MALKDDFTVYPYSKVIRHTNASSDSVYTAQAFYSWLMDLFDEPAYMSYQAPIKYNTPTQYTMQNGWFIDNGDGSEALKYLYGGSILTANYSGDIMVIDSDAAVDCIAGDKDKPVQETTVIGPLLAYKNDYPVADDSRVWVRNTGSHPGVDNNDSWSIVAGTGSGTATTGSYSGNEVYTNVYSIATFPTDVEPQIYIFQHDPDSTDTRIAEWSQTDSWDRGTFDVIVPVQIGGNLINSGLVNVFARQSGDTFTHVKDVDLSAGSRTPVALETNPDEVNLVATEGNHADYYMFVKNQTGDNFAVDDVIQDEATSSLTPPSWYAEVVAWEDWGSTGLLTLRGLRGTPADSDDIYVGTGSLAQVNGTVGDTYVPYDAESQQPAAGDLSKVFEGDSSGAQRVLRAYQDDGGTGKLLFQVYHAHAVYDSADFTGTGRKPLYRDFADDDQIVAVGGGAMSVTASADSTTLVSGFSDVTIAHVNGTINVDTFAGTFVEGERITWSGGGPAIMLYTNGSSTMTLGNVEDETNLDSDGTQLTGDISGATCEINGGAGMSDANTQNYEFPLQSEGDTYSVFIQGGSIYEAGRTLDHVYAYDQFRCRDGEAAVFYTSDGSSITQVQGQAYITADSSYAVSKPAPFGTLAGGVFFGAQGVWIEGMASADSNNIKLTSHEGNPREPYTSVSVTVGNTRVSDVVAVFLEAGSTGLPDKQQFTCASNTKSASTLQGSATHPNDTPSDGWVYVIDTSANEEHKYRFTSWSTDTLTLAAEVTGTAEAGTTEQTLIDTGVFASGVVRGDIIRRTSDDAWCYVISVDSDDQVTTTVLSDGTAWAESDAFEVNSLVADYTAADYYFIPYLEGIEDTGTDASPGNISDTLTFVTPRSVVIRARNVLNASYRIQPFVTTSDITSGGMTVSVIRNEDEVYS